MGNATNVMVPFFHSGKLEMEQSRTSLFYQIINYSSCRLASFNNTYLLCDKICKCHKTTACKPF